MNFGGLGLAFQPTRNDEDSTSSKCLSNRMRLIIAIVSGVTAFLSLLALSIALTMIWKAKGRSSVFRATVMPTTTRPTFLIRQPGLPTSANTTRDCPLPLIPIYNQTGITAVNRIWYSQEDNTIFLNNNKNLYLLVKQNNTLTKYLTSSNETIEITLYPKLSNPAALFVDDNENVFILDNFQSANNPDAYVYRVVVYWPSSTSTNNSYDGIVLINGFGSGKSYGISMDSDFNIYTSDYDNHRIIKWFSPNYTDSLIVTENLTPDTYDPNRILFPINIYINPFDNDELFILNQKGYGGWLKWDMRNSNGTIAAWKWNGHRSSGGFQLDCNGNIFITDGSDYVQFFRSTLETGINGVDLTAKVNDKLVSLALDPTTGDLYVLGKYLKRIQKFKLMSQVKIK
ncbi:unnamed protein product, partial [Didymodactylos carnosus]